MQKIGGLEKRHRHRSSVYTDTNVTMSRAISQENLSYTYIYVHVRTCYAHYRRVALIYTSPHTPAPHPTPLSPEHATVHPTNISTAN